MLLSLLLSTASGFILPLSLDHDLVYSIDTGSVQEDVADPISTSDDPIPFLEGVASWYDYKLSGKWRSKSHSACALRIKERY